MSECSSTLSQNCHYTHDVLGDMWLGLLTQRWSSAVTGVARKTFISSNSNRTPQRTDIDGALGVLRRYREVLGKLAAIYRDDADREYLWAKQLTESVEQALDRNDGSVVITPNNSTTKSFDELKFDLKQAGELVHIAKNTIIRKIEDFDSQLGGFEQLLLAAHEGSRASYKREILDLPIAVRTAFESFRHEVGIQPTISKEDGKPAFIGGDRLLTFIEARHQFDQCAEDFLSSVVLQPHFSMPTVDVGSFDRSAGVPFKHTNVIVDGEVMSENITKTHNMAGYPPALRPTDKGLGEKAQELMRLFADNALQFPWSMQMATRAGGNQR